MDSEKICEMDSRDVKLPEESVHTKLFEHLSKFFKSEGACQVYLALYPHLKEGGTWTSWALFQQIKEIPEVRQVVKSEPALRHHLNQFVQSNILLSENGGKKTTFQNNNAFFWNYVAQFNTLASQKFKMEVDYQYQNIYIVVDIITRMLKIHFPTAPVGTLYDLTHIMVEICTQLTLSDLQKRGIPDIPCEDCGYPCPETIEPFPEFTEPPPSIEEDPPNAPSRKDEITPLQIQNATPTIPKTIPKPPPIDFREEKPLQTKIPPPSLTPLNELEDEEDVDIPKKISPPPVMQSQP